MENNSLILQRFKEGDQVAFRWIFDQLDQKLKNWTSFKLLASIEEAEDLVADCWQKAYSQREKFISLDHLFGWCYQVVRNARIDANRLDKKRHEVIKKLGYSENDIEEEDASAKENAQRLQLEKMRYLIQFLPKRSARVLNMYFFQELDTPAIAELMGISPQTALNHKTMAIIRLRQLWDNKGPLKKAREGVSPIKAINKKVEECIEEQIVIPRERYPKIPFPSFERKQRIIRPTTYFTEAEFIEKFRCGEKVVFRQAFDWLCPKMLSYSKILTRGNEPEAEDIVAEAWYQLFLRRASMQSFDHIRRLGYKCISWEAIRLEKERMRNRQLAKNHYWLSDQFEDSVETFLGERCKSKAQEEILKILVDLPGKRGEVLLLNFIRKLSIEKIAILMGVTNKAVYKNRAEGLEKMRELLLITGKWVI